MSLLSQPAGAGWWAESHHSVNLGHQEPGVIQTPNLGRVTKQWGPKGVQEILWYCTAIPEAWLDCLPL